MTLGTASRDRSRSRRATTALGAAFGLSLESQFVCPGLTSAGATHGDLSVVLEFVDRSAIAEALDSPGWVRVSEERRTDGTVLRSLDRHPTLGHLLSGEHLGDHLVSQDGRHILSAAPGIDRYLLERVVIGMILPTAALIQGLEIFHASAVVIGDRVLACVGTSGSGKSSVATHLVLGGAAFFADDVLSVAVDRSDVYAYPGADLLNVRWPEFEMLTPNDQTALGVRVRADAERVAFRVQRDSRRLPLGAVYVLDRSPTHQRLAVSTAPDFRYTFACSYDVVTNDPTRAVNLFEVCGQLDALDRVRVVHVPDNVTASAVAAFIKEHFCAD